MTFPPIHLTSYMHHNRQPNGMKAFSALGLLLIVFVAPCHALTLRPKRDIGTSINADGGIPSDASRRNWIQNSILLASTSLVNTNVAFAEDKPKEGLLTTTEVAELLHPVPTFAIVDKRGVPFMVVGEDAKVTGYFFTTYGEAARILKVAKDSANKAIAEAKAERKPKEEIGINPWTKARVSSIPLDTAITLVSKSTASFGGGNYFRSEFELFSGK